METLKLRSENIEKMQKLGNGACGNVYRYSNDLAIKVYKDAGIDVHDEEDFIAKLGIQNDTCVFPKCRVEVDGVFLGYAMEYVEGEMLCDVVKKINITDLNDALKKAEIDLLELAERKIVFADVNHGGIMWSSDGKIKVIDTDAFSYNNGITKEETNRHNLWQFNSMIEMETEFLMGPVINYLNCNPDFHETYFDYIRSTISKEPMSVTVLFEKAAELFEKEFGAKVTTIEEMERIIGEKNKMKSGESKPFQDDKVIPSFDQIPSIGDFPAGKRFIDREPLNQDNDMDDR